MEVQKHCIVVKFIFFLLFFDFSLHITHTHRTHPFFFYLFLLFSNLVNMYRSKWDCQKNYVTSYFHGGFVLSRVKKTKKNKN